VEVPDTNEPVIKAAIIPLRAEAPTIAKSPETTAAGQFITHRIHVGNTLKK
jgi:hypothetical protein